MTDATEPADLEIQATATSAVERYHAAMADHRLSEALAAMMDLAGATNGYAESQAPWALDKAGEAERVGQVLAVMAEACRIIGHLLAPVAPSRARRIHEQLGVPVPYDERGAGGPGLDDAARVGRRTVRLAGGAARADLPAPRGRGGGDLSRRRAPERLPGLVDSHAHLQHARFDADRDEVIARAVEAGIERICVPGWDLASSEGALELASRHPGIVDAAVGVHPHHAAEMDEAGLGAPRGAGRRPAHAGGGGDRPRLLPQPVAAGGPARGVRAAALPRREQGPAGARPRPRRPRGR